MIGFGAEQGQAPRMSDIAGDILHNLRAWIEALIGPSRRAGRRADYHALFARHRREGLILLGLVAATMILFDPFVRTAVLTLPYPLVAGFNDLTDYGRSGWLLVPLGAALLLLAAIDLPALDRLSRGVLAALAVRFGFLFVAIGLPSLAGTVVKRLIGRVRPSDQGWFLFYPLSWRSDYASFPSGHATTVFAALVAIGYIVPRARPFLWAYALVIAASRVIVSAHYPSDVIAGAAFGAFGAMLVREWFAARGLGFYLDANGTVLAPPFPSMGRVRRAIRAALDDRFPPAWRAAVLAVPSRWYKRMCDAVGGVLARKPQFEWNAMRLALANPVRSHSVQPAEGAYAAQLDFDWSRGVGGPLLAQMSVKHLAGAGEVQPADREIPDGGGAERPHVSVVVPVRNEADNVAPLVEEIAASLAVVGSFEVVYVDDGSTDGTAAEIERLRDARPWLRHIRHAVSCGQSAAVRTGSMAARAAFVLTLDGDGQNDPAFLPALLEKLERNPRVGLVAGQRVARKDTGFKKLQSRTANAVRNAVLRDGTRDTGCGLKAFRRDVFLALPYFDGLHRFLPALVRRDGYEIAYVDVIDRPRRAGVSKYGLWDRLWVGILDLAGVWWLVRRKARVPRAGEVFRHAD